MTIFKEIKKIEIDGITYKLGYALYSNKKSYDYTLKDHKLYPDLGAYENERMIFGVGRVFESETDFFFGVIRDSAPYFEHASTMKKIFEGLRKYHTVPQEIEDEYERIYNFYKNNGFKEKRED